MSSRKNLQTKNDSKKYDDEVQAKIEPLTKPEKQKRRIISIIILVILVAAASVVVFCAITFSHINSLSKSIKNTFSDDGIQVIADISKANDLQNGMVDFKADGTIKIDKSGKESKLICDLDYGKRLVSVQLLSNDNDAYLYLRSNNDSAYMKFSISAINYMFDSETTVDWDKIISGFSTDESLNLNDYYDTAKVDVAINNIKKQISSPIRLVNLFDYKYKNGNHVFTTDSYQLSKSFANCIKPMFKSEQSYKNLTELIKSEKKALKEQDLIIEFTEKDGVISDLKVSFDDKNRISEYDFKLDATIKGANENAFNNGDIFNKDNFSLIPKEVSFDVAYNRLRRIGLDTDKAFSAAKEALNTFTEKHSFDIQDGTIVLIYDESGNMFGYNYQNYRLNYIQYGDELYPVIQNKCANYVALNTSGIKVRDYKIGIFEPPKTNADYSEDYNNALLSATHAMQSIFKAGYTIADGSVFVVIENDTEFQFTYQQNSLYDVLSQYYYYAYDKMAKADLSGISDIPSNVTLYITGQTSEK